MVWDSGAPTNVKRVKGAGLPCASSFFQTPTAPAPAEYVPKAEPAAANAIAATAPIRPISAAASGVIDIPFCGWLSFSSTCRLPALGERRIQAVTLPCQTLVGRELEGVEPHGMNQHA